MRDIVITLIVFGSLPFIVKRPYIGVLMWVWISVMNPHRLAYGFAYSFQFAAIVAAVTLLALVITKQEKKLPITPIVITLLTFTGWMIVTTIFAMRPEPSYVMLERVLKIMTMSFVTMMLIKTRRQLYLLIWTMVGSLAYYGVKGGVFTALSGGSSIVWGPAGSYIEGNNELALALITLIPIMYALFMEAQNKWVRRGLLAMMLLCGLSALGSYSRGALLAIAAMIVFLWLKSPKKAMVGAMLVLLFPLAIVFMPDKWTQRMETIQTYNEDSSAMGRINAWHMAYNLAKDRPLVGGGFDVSTGAIFALYAPDPLAVHAAHSIYFQALGEHGFVGLGLYLLLCVQTWRTGTWIMRNTKQREDLKWAYGLANMLHVSMIGFGVGGAFLSLLYFDVPYYLMAVMVILQTLVRKELEASPVNYPRKGSFSPKPVA